jgi:hypothetical protein
MLARKPWVSTPAAKLSITAPDITVKVLNR